MKLSLPLYVRRVTPACSSEWTCVEAALHMDLKEATQVVYEAVWSDPSDPSKTYHNAARALLAALRKRAGISTVSGAAPTTGSLGYRLLSLQADPLPAGIQPVSAAVRDNLQRHRVG